MNRTCFFVVWMAAIAPIATPQAPAAPSNDNFVQAELLEGSSGSVRGMNDGATREAGEPMIDGYEGGKSVWWRWVAASTEEVTFHTFGSGFDTVLGVYSGTAVGSLQVVAENDDGGEGFHSMVVFEAVAGEVYHLAVDGVEVDDGEGVESGNILLGWASGKPVNDDFAAGMLLEGPWGRASGVNFGATLEAGEPMVDGVEGGRSVWWRWVAPSTEKVTVHTVGSSFDTQLGVYTGTGVTALQLVAENDDIFLGPGVCRQPPCRRPPPPRTRPESRVDFDAVAGTLYHFVVDGFDGETGSILLTWLPAPEVSPENDDFSSRVRLEGPDGLALGSSVGATTELDEPDHAAGGGTGSVWWSWVTPGEGTVEISTHGSTFDTVLAVYTGVDVGHLDLVAENDDQELTEEEISVVRFRVAGETEYQIAVAGYDTESGIVALAWSFTPGGNAPRFVRGDCDGNGAINISDAVCSLDWLFRGGAEPGCVAAANVDGTGAVNIADTIHLLAHLFRGGPAPFPPFPGCGPGTLDADDEVGCGTPPESCR